MTLIVIIILSALAAGVLTLTTCLCIQSQRESKRLDSELARLKDRAQKGHSADLELLGNIEALQVQVQGDLQHADKLGREIAALPRNESKVTARSQTAQELGVAQIKAHKPHETVTVGQNIDRTLDEQVVVLEQSISALSYAVGRR